MWRVLGSTTRNMNSWKWDTLTPPRPCKSPSQPSIKGPDGMMGTSSRSIQLRGMERGEWGEGGKGSEQWIFETQIVLWASLRLIHSLHHGRRWLWSPTPSPTIQSYFWQKKWRNGRTEEPKPTPSDSGMTSKWKVQTSLKSRDLVHIDALHDTWHDTSTFDRVAKDFLFLRRESGKYGEVEAEYHGTPHSQCLRRSLWCQLWNQ